EGERHRVDDDGLETVQLRIDAPVREFAAKRFEALPRGDERVTYSLAHLLPTCSLQQREPARRLRFEWRASFETWQARIAAAALGDRGRDVPHVIGGLPRECRDSSGSGGRMSRCG